MNSSYGFFIKFQLQLVFDHSYFFLLIHIMLCEQTDGTYTHNIEKFVHQVCNLARVHGDEHHTSCLRASSLQCLSAMVIQ